MTDLLDGILEQLGEGGVAKLSNSLGVDQSQMGGLLASSLPSILAGMANNTKTPEGASALSNALGAHDGSIFDSLPDLIGKGGGDGGKILGHVLGNKQSGIEQGLAKKSGVDLSIIMKLLPILAPLVMGYLSKQKSSQGLDAGGLGDILGRERTNTERSNPGLGGLAAILDSNGDGSFIDDILGKLGGA